MRLFGVPGLRNTDLRRGIDRLAGIVQSQFQLDPFQHALFLFCGRRKDRIKGLYWEGDGFALLYGWRMEASSGPGREMRRKSSRRSSTGG